MHLLYEFKNCISVMIVLIVKQDLFNGLRARARMAITRAPSKLARTKVRDLASDLEFVYANCISIMKSVPLTYRHIYSGFK